jgi:hypothetical protein
MTKDPTAPATIIRNKILDGRRVEWFNDLFEYTCNFEMTWIATARALISCKRCDKTFIVHEDRGVILLDEEDKKMLDKHLKERV